MKTFKVGDRVWHKLHPKNAGTITKVGGFNSVHDSSKWAHVGWDFGTVLFGAFGSGGSTHPFSSLVLVASSELQYDPMQQGDTDEDI